MGAGRNLRSHSTGTGCRLRMWCVGAPSHLVRQPSRHRHALPLLGLAFPNFSTQHAPYLPVQQRAKRHPITRVEPPRPLGFFVARGGVGKPGGSAEWAAEPYLLVWGLLVDHVGAVRSETQRQNTRLITRLTSSARGLDSFMISTQLTLYSTSHPCVPSGDHSSTSASRWSYSVSMVSLERRSYVE